MGSAFEAVTSPDVRRRCTTSLCALAIWLPIKGRSQTTDLTMVWKRDSRASTVRAFLEVVRAEYPKSWALGPFSERWKKLLIRRDSSIDKLCSVGYGDFLGNSTILRPTVTLAIRLNWKVGRSGSTWVDCGVPRIEVRAKLPPRRSDRFAALLAPNCRPECVRETSVVAEPNRWLDWPRAARLCLDLRNRPSRKCPSPHCELFP